ncbi:MAG: diguanylate cyclase, partial [Rhodospirillaceae bacterium]|nr:diguanylate cyclase [Rhodospirillaceae bacterium]
MFKKFQTKLVLFFAALFAVVQAVSYLAVQNNVRSSILDEASNQLAKAYTVFLNDVETTTTALAEGSEILASDFGFRQAVATNDRPTIMSAINNLGDRIKADRVILVDLDNKIIGDTGSAADAAATGNIVTMGSDDAMFPFPEIITEADDQGRAVYITAMDEQVYQTVVIPIRAPVTIASLVIGIEIDRVYVGDLVRKFTVPLEITFAREDAAQGRWIPHTTTLKPELTAPLMGFLKEIGATDDKTPRTMKLDGQDFVGLIATLSTPPGSPKVDAVIQYSLDASLKPFEQLFLTLIALAAGTLILTLIGSYAIAGSVAKPIRVLDAAARRIQGGDYKEKVVLAQQDEIGRLSETFNQMMEGIAEREATIEYQSLHDPGTGLPNRLAFERRLEEAIKSASQSNAPFSVYLVQIGRFSEINNTLGHDTGEKLIAKIGENLKTIVKTSDMIARHSSSMFALLLPSTVSTEPNPAVARILESFNEPVSVEGSAIDVTAWIGEACYPAHGADGRTLLQR